MAKRKTARGAKRTGGRQTTGGRTTARGDQRGGAKKASARPAAGRTGAARAAGSPRTPAAGARKAAAGTRGAGTPVRKTAAGARTSAAGAARRTGATPKALPRRKAGAATTRAGGPPRGTSAKKTTGRPRGRSASTPPRKSFGARGGPSLLAEIDRDRRLLEETVETPPSSLDMDRRASAARTGRSELREALEEHTETGPALTAGDVDADWQSAYNTGDEAPGGDMPTPDKSVVEEIGTAIGVEYQDNEELKGVDKIDERDRHRWEFDPASSEDYEERTRKK
jgi:hypothetical protein